MPVFITAIDPVISKNPDALFCKVNW